MDFKKTVEEVIEQNEDALATATLFKKREETSAQAFLYALFLARKEFGKEGTKWERWYEENILEPGESLIHNGHRAKLFRVVGRVLMDIDSASESSYAYKIGNTDIDVPLTIENITVSRLIQLSGVFEKVDVKTRSEAIEKAMVIKKSSDFQEYIAEIKPKRQSDAEKIKIGYVVGTMTNVATDIILTVPAGEMYEILQHLSKKYEMIPNS